MRQLRDCGFGKTSIESMIHEEISACTDNIKASLEKSNDSVTWVHDVFGVSLINILWAVTAGERFSHTDQKFKNILAKLTENFRSGNPLANLFEDYPILKRIPIVSRPYHKSEATSAEVKLLIQVSITEVKVMEICF